MNLLEERAGEGVLLAGEKAEGLVIPADLIRYLACHTLDDAVVRRRHRSSQPSWQQLQRPREPGSHSDRAEVAPVGGQNTVNMAALSDCGHRTIYESQIEFRESGVKLERAGDV
jgi:hypothetical protein